MKQLLLRTATSATLALLPIFAFAQLLALNPAVDGWAAAMLKFTYIINVIIIPVMLSIAFVMFLLNIFLYAVATSDPKAREQAKKLMIYGIAAFVLIICFWGIVNLLVRGLGLGQEAIPCNDFFEDYAGIFTMQNCE